MEPLTLERLRPQIGSKKAEADAAVAAAAAARAKRGKRKARAVRIFCSSTFADMGEDRARIQQEVLPALEMRCRERGLLVSVLDLQWGIPGGTPNDEIIRTCLTELDRCADEAGHALFVWLGGARYGWSPTPDAVPADIAEPYEWLPGASITTMEVLHGALRRDNPLALFCLRDHAYIDSLPHSERFAPEGWDRFRTPDVADQQDALRAAIEESARGHPGRIFWYNPALERSGTAAASSAAAAAAAAGAGAALTSTGAESASAATASPAGGTSASAAPLDAAAASGAGGSSPDKPLSSWHAFSAALEARIWDRICAIFGDGDDAKPVSWRQAQADLHGAFADQLLKSTDPRQMVLEPLLAAVRAAEAAPAGAGGARAVVVHAASGAGKTSVMAALAAALEDEPADEHPSGTASEATAATAAVAPGTADATVALPRRKRRVLAHFCGAVERSEELGLLARRILCELERSQPGDAGEVPAEELPADAAAACAKARSAIEQGGAVEAFGRASAAAAAAAASPTVAADGAGAAAAPAADGPAAEQPSVVIVIDAVNQLRGKDAAARLCWLSAAGAIAPNVTLVISVADDDHGGADAAELTSRLPAAQRVYVTPLSLEERRQIANFTLASFHKRLSPAHTELLITNPGAASPVWLRLALLALRQRAKHETLEEDIGSLHSDTRTLVAAELLAAEYKLGRAHVQALALLLAVMRDGISEAEALRLVPLVSAHFASEAAAAAAAALAEEVALAAAEDREFADAAAAAGTDSIAAGGAGAGAGSASARTDVSTPLASPVTSPRPGAAREGWPAAPTAPNGAPLLRRLPSGSGAPLIPPLDADFPMPAYYWARLRASLAFCMRHVVGPNDGWLSLGHGLVREAVIARYGEDALAAVRRIVAEFFSREAPYVQPARRALELPHQLSALEDWPRLRDALCEPWAMSDLWGRDGSQGQFEYLAFARAAGGGTYGAMKAALLRHWCPDAVAAAVTAGAGASAACASPTAGAAGGAGAFPAAAAPAQAPHTAATAVTAPGEPASPATAAAAPAAVDEARGRILEAVGLALIEMAGYSEAFAVLDAALTAFGGQDACNAGAARVLALFGRAAMLAAQYPRAKALLQRGIAVNEAVFGAASESLGLVWRVLGNTHERCTEYADAVAAYNKALAIRREVLGPNHRDVAAVLCNLGMVFQQTNRLEEAKAHYGEALRVCLTTCDEWHPSVGIALNGLGFTLMRQGDMAGSRVNFERALAIRTRAYGEEHPLTAATLNNLSLCLRSLGAFAESAALSARALELRIRVLGPQHLDVARTSHNHGETLLACRDWVGAAAAFARGLDIRRALFKGKDNGLLMESHGAVARAQLRRGLLDEAKASLTAVFEMQARILGAEKAGADPGSLVAPLLDQLNRQKDTQCCRDVAEEAALLVPLVAELLGSEHAAVSRMQAAAAELLAAADARDAAARGAAKPAAAASGSA